MSKKIVILGAGYAGISVAKELEKYYARNQDIEIKLIEKNSYHTLLTELHEVAGGRVLPNAVQVDLNRIFKSNIVDVIQDEIVSIDFDSQKLFSNNHEYTYDYLVLSTGSRPCCFNLPGVNEYAYQLWSHKEAIILRNHIYNCFQKASTITDREERKKLLTFVIAGGGFTGVELAGELGEWKNKLCKQFSINVEEVNIYLVEALPNILNILDKNLAKKCEARLKKIGINVLTECGIKSVDKDSIYLSNEEKIEGTLIWTAGIQGNPFIGEMDIKCDRRFRVEVNDYMQSIQYKNVFCAGDTISHICDGKPLPQVVETALQTGSCVAKNIINIINGKEIRPFNPNYHGVLVSVGFSYAVAKVMGVKCSGIVASALKHMVNIHYLYLIGKLSLVMDYIKHQFLQKRYCTELNVSLPVEAEGIKEPGF